jgi:type IV pilus assembly protein PilW
MKQRGFTVVELMVAMTIGLLVSALVVVVFAGSVRTYRLSDTHSELIETGRTALDAMERDIRMAGFRGCNSNNVGGSAPLTNVIDTPAAYANELNAAVRVYDTTGGGFVPALPAALVGIPDGSDVLVLRMPTGPVLPVTATMASGTGDITLAGVGDFVVGSRAVIANCSAAAAFRVTGIAGTSLQHAAGALNSTADFSTAFDVDAVVVPYVTRAYFVAPSSNGVAGQSSLWVRDNLGAAVELIENIEQMQILVGIDTNADMVANSFANVDAATNFDQVMALQIHLLSRGARNDETTTDLTYRFAGQSIAATDRFARRVFTSTILLRNRTL